MSDTIRVVVQAVSELPTINDQLDELIKLTKQAQQQAATFADEQQRGMIRVVAASRQATDAIDEQTASLKKAGTASSQTTGQVSNDFKGLESQVSSFQKLLIAAFTLSEIKSFATDVLDAKTKMDSLKISLDVMLGSKRESMDLMADIVQLAKTTPFTLEEVSEQVVKLKAYNIATEDLIPTITALGNIAAAVGKEKLPQLTLAYGQVANTGRLMGTELKQFVEAGVPLFDLLATSMNKPKQAIIELQAAHEITFENVKKALLDASEVGGKYYNLMVLQSKTLGGQVSNLSDTFFLAKARVGDYFENGVANGIGIMADLIDVVAGSNAAISRTISTITAATATWVAGRLALSLYNAQALIAAGRANEMTLSQRILTLTNVEASAAAGASTVTLRGLWAVMAANPIGALLTAVSLLVAAWQGYDAINTQISNSMDDSGEKLQIEQANVNLLANQILGLNDGNERRKDLIQLLITKYPDYFEGLNAETLNNAQLKTILDKVNGSYERRIELARITYQTEKANDNLQDLFAKEDELMKRAKQVLPADMFASINNDSAKLLDLLKNNRVAAGYMATDVKSFFKGIFTDGGLDGFQGMLESTRAGIDENGKVLQSANLAIIASTKDRNASLKSVEDERHTQALSGLKKGTADYEAENKRHSENVKSIEKDKSVAVVATNQGTADKVKTITVLSAKEIDVLLKQGYEDTVKQQLAFIDAQEKADIEAVNKRTVSKKATGAQLAALEKEVSDKILAIHAEANAKREKVEFDAYKVRSAELGEFVNKELATIATLSSQNADQVEQWKQNAKDRVEAEKYAQDARKESAQVTKEALEQEHASYKQSLAMLLEIGSQASGIGGMFAKGVKMVWENIDLLSGKTVETAQNALSQAKTNLDAFVAIQDTTSAKGVKQLADLQGNVTTATAAVGKASAMSFESVVGFAGMAYQVFTAIADAYNASVKAQYEAIANGMSRAREAYKNFYDWYVETSKDAYDTEMAAFSGSLDEKQARIRAFYNEQAALQKQRDGVDAQLGYYQDMAAAAAAMVESAKEGIEALIDAQKNKALREQQAILNQLAIEKAALKDAYDAKIASLDAILDKAKQTLSDETDAAKAAYDAKKTLIEKERDEAKDALNAQADFIKNWYDEEIARNQKMHDAEIDAANARYDAERAQIQATYDLKQELNTQSIADAIEEVSILDRIRLETLERYKADETERITSTRDRILATLTDEAEKALVTSEYEKQLKDLHDAVEDAKLDKSKGVSLATKQLQKEEKDNAELLKEQETAKLLELEVAHKAAVKQSQDEFDAWKEDQRAVQAQREQEIKDQLVTLQKITDQKLEDAQRELNAKIIDLQNQLRDTQIAILEQKKAAEIGYNNSVRALKHDEWEAQKQMLIIQLLAETAKMRASRGLFKNNDLENAINAIEDQVRVLMNTANPFYHGTEYVDDKRQPDGIDTVPAMLTKGERVLTVEQNRAIGPMSNNELVQRLMMPRASMPNMMPVRMNIPDLSSAAMSGGNVIGELQALRQELREKKLLQLNIDNGGIALAMLSESAKQTYISNKIQF